LSQRFEIEVCAPLRGEQQSFRAYGRDLLLSRQKKAKPLLAGHSPMLRIGSLCFSEARAFIPF